MATSAFDKINMFLRTIVYGAIVGLCGWGGYELNNALTSDQDQLEEKSAQIQELNDKMSELEEEHASQLQKKESQIKQQESALVAKAEEITRQNQTIKTQNATLKEQEQQIDTLEEDLQQVRTSLRLLKMDHRLARVEILEQNAVEGEEENRMRTKFRFVEVDSRDNPISDPIIGTVEGREIYIDGQVVRFNDEFVELGDELRGRPIVRFRRIYGEEQPPRDGVSLESPPKSPGEMTEFEKKIWANLMDYANDPEKAATEGVRSVSGGGPSILNPKPGMIYRLDLRSSGLMEIRPLPPKESQAGNN
ncbi:Hypothetical protein PBC10988_19650 [Planctomycetales bacterium 10988]|nr:Hypothetical protein PBC10988_19650 [Planctomycetales bacterium 10988]